MRRALVTVIYILTISVPAIGDDLCWRSFSHAEVSVSLRAYLDSNLKMVPAKLATSLVRKLSGKIEKGNVAESDVLKVTERYYRALDKPWFSRFFNNLSLAHNSEALRHREEFYQKLKTYLAQEGIVLDKSVWAKFKEWVASNRGIISATHFLAVHGAVATGMYALQGDFQWFLFYLPTLSSKKVLPINNMKVATHYYDRLSAVILRVYYASALAFFALNPTQTVNELHSIKDSIQHFNQVVIELTVEQQTNLSASISASVGVDKYAKDTQEFDHEVTAILSRIDRRNQ